MPKKKDLIRTEYLKLPGSNNRVNVFIVDRSGEEIVKCEDCDMDMTLRYVKQRGLRCPNCKRIFDEIKDGMTKHFKQKGERKARAILTVMTKVNMKYRRRYAKKASPTQEKT